MNWLEAAALLVCAVGMGAFYYLMDFAPKSPRRMFGKNKDYRMPDLRFHNTANELYAAFEQAGEEGRPKMRRYWLLDFGFIVCFFGVMIFIGWNVAGRGTQLFMLMAVAAAARAVLDVAENVLFLSLLRVFPARRNGLAAFAGAVTSAKFVCLYLWVGMLFYKLFLAAFRIA